MMPPGLQFRHSSSKTWLREARNPFLPAILLACSILTSSSAQAQTFTVLHTFRGQGDGKLPAAGVIRDPTGNLYGTTVQGGALDMGAAFELDPNGHETVLHSFWGGDGLGPGELIRTHAGNLYGATGDGGIAKGGGCRYGCGTVFELDRAGKHRVLYAFTGGSDGAGPEGPLVRDAEGNFYGATGNGGDLACGSPFAGCGVIFKLDRRGKQTVLYTFTDGNDGGFPGPVIRDKAGNFYGTAADGALGAGVVFKLDPAGKETVLYSFAGGTDGGGPSGPLVRDTAGNLYGTSRWGGDPYWQMGVVFKIDPAGKETVSYDFHGSSDGWLSNGGLARDRQGNLYGTTSYGGDTSNCLDGCGIVFEVDVNGNETILHSFAGGSDGASPNAELLMDRSRNLYGTAVFGGDLSCVVFNQPGCGVVFEISPQH